MEAASEIELDGQYRALREEAGFLVRSGQAMLDVTGPEAVDYLQGQLTNDIEAIEPGSGGYSALLDRKGHMQGDMRVLRVGPEALWLDLEPEALPAVLRHLSMYKIGREVEVADRSADLALISLLGPRAPQLAGVEGLGPEHAHREASLGGTGFRAVAGDGGVDLICAAADLERLEAALLEAGAERASEDAAEIVRVESGRPRFGRELNQSLMPAEAGIAERAVNFEKGCYIGQEPVARLHYRGKPNRTLRGLRLSAPAEPGTTLSLGDREVGAIGTACVSPALGPIALAIVRREAEPGATVELAGGGSAEVVELPFAG